MYIKCWRLKKEQRQTKFVEKNCTRIKRNASDSIILWLEKYLELYQLYSISFQLTSKNVLLFLGMLTHCVQLLYHMTFFRTQMAFSFKKWDLSHYLTLREVKSQKIYNFASGTPPKVRIFQGQGPSRYIDNIVIKGCRYSDTVRYIENLTKICRYKTFRESEIGCNELFHFRQNVLNATPSIFNFQNSEFIIEIKFLNKRTFWITLIFWKLISKPGGVLRSNQAKEHDIVRRSAEKVETCQNIQQQQQQ